MNLEIEKYWQEQFMKALTLEGISDPSFFNFLNGKVKRIAVEWDAFPWACFPQLDDQEIIRDIRIVVPVITDIKSLLVNLHEYTHAYELYQEVGMKYIERTEERETKAKEAEKRYLLHYSN